MLESPFKPKAKPRFADSEKKTIKKLSANGRQAHLPLLTETELSSWNPLSNRRQAHRAVIDQLYNYVGIPFQTEGEAKVR
jgi:hypothetical protein